MKPLTIEELKSLFNNDWVWVNFGGERGECGKTAYAVYETEREAMGKCEKLNTMLYPPLYILRI